MISEPHTKEGLSRSYVQAVAAKAGINIEVNGRSHDYGFDGTFHQVNVVRGKRGESGASIDFQLKASVRCVTGPGDISYELDADTYNSLANRTSGRYATPALLVLLALPKDPESWLTLGEDQLILRNCCYWIQIPPEQTSNNRSVTIKIPRSQRLTPESLVQLLRSVQTTGKIEC